MPGETRTNMGTMSYNYNETGTYRITAKIQCNAPLTIPRLSKEYTVEIQII
ncbi:hypothetical protein HZB02_01585 [Candidatus Woesearchaeota archaeon]|nr:hypothetical protein [Candidatus Woesearchaeota archaeon]